MFRELDQRNGNGLIITLEWNPASDQVRLRLDDQRSNAPSFVCVIDPADARLGFLDPFGLLRLRNRRWVRRGRDGQQRTGLRLRRHRFRPLTPNKPAEPADATLGQEGLDILKSWLPFNEMGFEWF